MKNAPRAQQYLQTQVNTVAHLSGELFGCPKSLSQQRGTSWTDDDAPHPMVLGAAKLVHPAVSTGWGVKGWRAALKRRPWGCWGMKSWT